MAEAIATHSPRFLLLRGGAIGDFVVTLPVLQALRAQWPLAQIEIWGYPHIASLALAGGLAESVVSLDRAEMARFFVPVPQFTDAQVAAIRSFDLIFNYLHDPVGQVRSNLLLAGARQVLSGSPLIKRGHAIPFLLEPLHALALYDADWVPELDLPGDLRARVRRQYRDWGIRGRPVVVHPGSGSPAKTWPLEGFIDILRRLLESGREVVILVGEADRERSALLAQGMPAVYQIKEWPLVDVAAFLSESAFYLGNDSGITHIAAATGVPLVALFGPSDPKVWGPRGRAPVRILCAPDGDLERLQPDAVWEAVREALSPTGPPTI